MAAIRACGFAIGAAHLSGAKFGIAFGVLSTVGQAIAYKLGIRPDVGYKPATRPRITQFQVLAAANRTVGYAAAGYCCSLFAGKSEHAIAVGLTAGLAIGAVTAVVGTFTPFVEWTADHMPEKRMGVLGIGLIVIGFALQSAQYWVVVMDVNVR